MDFDVLFLCGLFPKETEKEIIDNSKGSIHNAANNFQWEVLSGLDSNLKNPVKVLNSLYVGSYPKRYKRLLLATYRFSHTTGSSQKDINVGFVNLCAIKHISRFISLRPHVRKWARHETGLQKVLIAYAMTSTFTHLIRYAKKINNKILTCLIVPDLPQYMNLSEKQSLIYQLFKEIECKIIYRDMKYINSYVLLTEHMHDVLKIDKPYTIIEGITSDVFETIETIAMGNDIKTILYSGGLNKKYGVLDLINAFERLPGEDYRLIICGTGDIEKEIIQACNRDKRIVFKGQLPRKEVLKLQKSSTLLVNPRANNENYTKYSFPSKIMEYLSSGTPMLAYELDGIPDEYRDYFFPVQQKEDGLYIALKEVLEMPREKLTKKGSDAKEFVLREKNNVRQVEKIIRMFADMNNITKN